MKAKTLIQTAGLTAAMMLLAPLLINAQIPIQGLASNHEGIATWNTNGTGLEAADEGHPLTFAGISNMPYYFASCDYRNINPNPDAAMCHFMDDIKGFPMFVKALYNAGFTPKDVKIKLDVMSLEEDIEGEDWFIIDNMHYSNYYNGTYSIELNSESIITGHLNYINSRISESRSGWKFKTSFSTPRNASGFSSTEVQQVAVAFLDDMDGQELRFVIEDISWSGEWVQGNGRDGRLYDITSGYLEKGFSKLPCLSAEDGHEGIAAWDADGTGNEPEARGHTFKYGGYTWWMAHYIASRDYNEIDPNANAAMCHFTDDATGFANLKLQMAYRGFTMDQLKIKSGISSFDRKIEGKDWGLAGNIHWYRHYRNTLTIEIAGQAILECVIDTNYCFDDLDNMNTNWQSYTSFATIVDVSANASRDAQFVAASFLRDIDGRTIKLSTEGNKAPGKNIANGRDGVFHQIKSGALTLGKSNCPAINNEKTNYATDPYFYNTKGEAVGFADNEVDKMDVIEISVSPNPFRGRVQIAFELPHPANVKLEIYNSVGVKIASLAGSFFQGGKQKIIWNAQNFSEGVYFCRLQAGDAVYTRKVIKAN